MKKVQIGILIKEARKEQGLSREDLAESLNVATTTILRWEKGLQGPSFEYMVELSKALKLPIGHFTGDESISVSVPEPIDNLEFASQLLSKISSLSPKNREMLLKSLDQMLKGQESVPQKKKASY